MNEKYLQCHTCYFNGEEGYKPCDKCINTDIIYNLEPPSEWIYEDKDGEWK